MAVPWVLVHRAAAVVALLLAVAVVAAVDRTDVVARLRRRFVLGLPLGTLTVVAFVVAVYLFVQSGWSHWYDPVVTPFRAWSYLYPLGMLTAAFSHAGPGHLLGNMFGTLVLAPLVEYAWGHFPRERGASSFSSFRTNPYARAFVVFPAATVVVGVFTALVTIGPVVGFSGVVFAFAGFALVRYPLGTVVALAATRVPNLLYSALVNPTTTASGRPAFVTPWWADIAIQGHAIGLLLGVVLGAVHLHRRADDPPNAVRLWVGVLLFAAGESLWAVYWYRGGGSYVLYRAVGLALVFALATIVTVAVAASDRPLRGWVTTARSAGDQAGVDADGGVDTDGVVDTDGGRPSGDRDAADDAGRGLRASVRTVSARQAGLLVLVLAGALLVGPALPVNLTTATDASLPGEVVHVGGYDVTYAERVPNGMVSAVDVSAFGETTNVNTSGVIVRNDDRGIWTTAVTKGRLAFAGHQRVVLGGVGWRETVVVRRQGWTAVGGGTAYRVTIGLGEDRQTVFTSPPARADPVVAGQNVSVAVDDLRFYVVAGAGNESVRAPLPGENESVTLRNVTFVGDGATVRAVHDGTNVTVLTKERYRGK